MQCDSRTRVEHFVVRTEEGKKTRYFVQQNLDSCYPGWWECRPCRSLETREALKDGMRSWDGGGRAGMICWAKQLIPSFREQGVFVSQVYLCLYLTPTDMALVGVRSNVEQRGEGENDSTCIRPSRGGAKAPRYQPGGD